MSCVRSSESFISPPFGIVLFIQFFNRWTPWHPDSTWNSFVIFLPQLGNHIDPRLDAILFYHSFANAQGRFGRFFVRGTNPGSANSGGGNGLNSELRSAVFESQSSP